MEAYEVFHLPIRALQNRNIIDDSSAMQKGPEKNRSCDVIGRAVPTKIGISTKDEFYLWR